MAFVIEHRPSGAALGSAAYLTGLNRSKQRQQEQALGIWQQERQNQIRQQERFQDYGYRTYLEGLRQDEADRRAQDMMKFRSSEADKDRMLRQQGIASRERIAGRNENYDLASKIYSGTQKQLEGIQKASGGMYTPGSPTYTAYDKYKKTIAGIDADQGEGGPGHLDALQALQARNKAAQEFLGKHNQSDVVPWEDRPGSIRTDEYGRQWLKSRDPNKPDEFHGNAPDSELTEQQRIARDAKREARLYRENGKIIGQYKMDRYGNEELVPLDLSANASKAEDKARAEHASIIKELYNEIGNQSGTPTTEDLQKVADDWAKLGRIPVGFKVGPYQSTQAPQQGMAPLPSELPIPNLIGSQEMTGTQQYQKPIGPSVSSGLPPLVRTPEEARRLPPGTEFRTEEGRTFRTPNRTIPIPSPSAVDDTEGSIEMEMAPPESEPKPVSMYQQSLNENRRAYEEEKKRLQKRGYRGRIY